MLCFQVQRVELNWRCFHFYWCRDGWWRPCFACQASNIYKSQRWICKEHFWKLFLYDFYLALYIFLPMHAIHCNWPDSELWWLVKCLWSWHPYLSFLLQAGALAAYYKLPLHRVVVVRVYDPIFLGDTLDWLTGLFAVWVSGIWWHRPAMWSSSFTT